MKSTRRASARCRLRIMNCRAHAASFDAWLMLPPFSPRFLYAISFTDADTMMPPAVSFDIFFFSLRHAASPPYAAAAVSDARHVFLSISLDEFSRGSDADYYARCCFFIDVCHSAAAMTLLMISTLRCRYADAAIYFRFR